MTTASTDARTQQIATWLGRFVCPGQVVELRGLHLPKRKISSTFWRCPEGLEKMARHALALEGLGAQGVYFTPNPLREDMGIATRSARDADVLERHWLLIDIDPVRFAPDGVLLAGDAARVASTDEEREGAWQVACQVRGVLELAGFSAPIVADSGNGWHLCYPVELPNDEQSKQSARTLLRGLHARCSNEQAKVDTSTFNAARIWKVPGTLARKGEHTQERPHRYAGLVQEG